MQTSGATKQVILFHHWTMEKLAKQLVADPAYAGRVRLGRCSWDSFPDSTPSIQIEPDDWHAAQASNPRLAEDQRAVLLAEDG